MEEGDPNEVGGAYQEAISILYALSYTLKMSKNSDWCPEGYFEYVVAPLEGLWTQKGRQGMDYAHKELLRWTAMIRQPEFVTEAVFEQAALEAQRKKGVDAAKAVWSAGRRDYAFSVCIWAAMMMSLSRWRNYMILSAGRGCFWIWMTSRAVIMSCIYPIPAKWRRID